MSLPQVLLVSVVLAPGLIFALLSYPGCSVGFQVNARSPGSPVLLFPFPHSVSRDYFGRLPPMVPQP